MQLRIVGFALIAVMLLSMAAAVPPEEASAYEALRAEAERHYAEKSFRRAGEVYAGAAQLALTPAQAEWVRFRRADTAWRADAAAPAADPSARAAARATLEELTRSGSPAIQAEANESLGDYDSRHEGIWSGVRWYLAALDYWAGSSEIETARGRYLAIVRRLAAAEYPGIVPRQVLTSAMEIAQSDADRALTRFLLASQLRQEGSAESRERALELFLEVAGMGRRSEWYDDALFNAGSLLAEEPNVSVPGTEQGGADYARALELFRKLLAEFPAGTSPFRQAAESQIATITRPDVGLHVPGAFLPASEHEVVLSWRNVARVDLAVYRVDLAEEKLDPRKPMEETIAIGGRTAERRWSFDTGDQGLHRPGSQRLAIDRLPAGAWLVTAAAGGTTRRQLLLVGDLHVLTHAARNRMQVYVSDVTGGRPVANARVRLVSARRNVPVERSGRTDANGLLSVDLTGLESQMLVVASAADGRQVWHRGWRPYFDEAEARPRWWRVYAFADRPAYRPGETVSWKVLARVRDGKEWSTPAGAALHYEITSPRGEKVAAGAVTLNEFGSAWGELPLDASMPLGMYHVSFRSDGPNAVDGGAGLFRLEEYKLPEYSVRVSTPEGKQVRLGDTIEATIEATYYFGGPVANATVTAVVHQQPYDRVYRPVHRYDWYFPPPSGHRNETRVSEQVLRTGPDGRAVLRIDTPRDGTETTYRIEARVVDASRREVRGEGSVRVMRQRYAVHARPEHFVHRPGASVSVTFHALDANEKPVRTTGKVEVFRRIRTETPPRPLPAARRRIAPPHPPVPERFEETRVAGGEVRTDADGRGTFTFTPREDGYYTFRWTSPDLGVDPSRLQARDVVRAETSVWVAERATTDVGYHPGSLDVVIDRETVRRGETVSVIVSAPGSGRWVMLTTSGDEVLETQVLRLDGTVKLVQFEAGEEHVPNFHVTASSVFDQEVSTDVEQVVVPPEEHFLEVDVRSDREEYVPRGEATFTVTTRDASGRPVAAEVGLSVADEAVTSIQEDPAGDPRPFFFGGMRGQAVQVSASVHEQRYLDLREEGTVEVEEGAIAGAAAGVAGGFASRRDAGMKAGAPPPPPPPPAAAAPQAITVTAIATEADMQGADAAGAANSAGGMEVQVRSDFRSTAFWKPDVRTGEDGTARVTVKLPESLTTWRATARAATRGPQVGIGSSTARTSLPLLVRLQSPRFFVTGDRAVVSAVINNNTAAPVTVTPSIEAAGLALEEAERDPVVVPANGDARVDWSVSAERAGEARISVRASAGPLGDAMERVVPVWEHGVDKLVASSGKLRGNEAVVRLALPRARRATELTVQVAPTLATTMLDALPYLIDFPYGCTEQTMSRFLPAAIVARTMEKLGLDRSAVERRVLARQPKPGVLPSNAASVADPKATLPAVTAAGMARLYDMQHDDGGWGWWKEGSSDAWMTAYVVWGFSIAREGGLPVRTAAVDRAAGWLETHLVDFERRPDDQAWMLHALSSWRTGRTAAEKRAFDGVWNRRERLSAYSRALLALAAHRYGETEKTKVLVRNLEDGVQVDRDTTSSTATGAGRAATAETLATAHWGNSRSFWWRWYESPVETTAFVLRALVTIEPRHRLVEPAMNWLVKNRRGSQWNNTRDTAIALLALEEYLERSGELAGNVAFELSVNGRPVGSRSLAADDVLADPPRFRVDPALLGDEVQEIRIRRTAGTAPLYFAAEARFVSLEEPVRAEGNELFVKREYFRMAPRPTLLKGVQYDRLPLADGGAVRSGERIEVVVTIDSKNDYSYLMFEDLKPAGFEAVALQSGDALYATQQKTGGSAWVHQELRDRKVVSFIDHLGQGVWELRYTLRAETPGSFHALPLLGAAMYVPDVRGNSHEVRVQVEEGRR